MQLFINITLLIAGAWNMGIGLLTNTKNVASALLFKATPVIIGMACLLSFLMRIGKFSF